MPPENKMKIKMERGAKEARRTAEDAQESCHLILATPKPSKGKWQLKDILFVETNK